VNDGLEIMREGNPPRDTMLEAYEAGEKIRETLHAKDATPLRRAMGFTDRLLPVREQDEMTGIAPRMEAHSFYWPGWWT
jgi:hypothetical protein